MFGEWRFGKGFIVDKLDDGGFSINGMWYLRHDDSGIGGRTEARIRMVLVCTNGSSSGTGGREACFAAKREHESSLPPGQFARPLKSTSSRVEHLARM